jgi:hypothetical protein
MMFPAVLAGTLLGSAGLAVILLAFEAFRWAARRVAARIAARSARRPPPVSVPPAVAGRRG